MKRLIYRLLFGALLLVAASAQSFLPSSSNAIPDPAISYDFARDVYYQPAASTCVSVDTCVTVTRASVGYADSVAGVWTSFASNLARRTDKGLLVEETRTNSNRNNSMQGVVAGTPGTAPTNWNISTTGNGLTRTIVGVGVEDGIDYIEIRYAGTASATASIVLRPEGPTTITASSGQTWTSSSFMRIVGGSNTGLSWFQQAQGRGGGTQTETVTVAYTPTTASLTSQRATATIVLASGSTTSFSGLPFANFTSGAVIDITLRMGWPQAELGAFATSPIRTTAAAAARAADVVTATNVPVIGSAFTFLGQGTPTSPTTNTIVQMIGAVSDGTSANRAQLYRSATNGFATSTTIGSSVVVGNNLSILPWPQNTSGKIAGAFATGDYPLAFNGVSSGLPTPAGTIPSGLTVFNIGNRPGAQWWNGYVERIALWPTTRLSDSQLQGLTAP